MNDSSTWPSALPPASRTVMLASATIVPIDMRCRRAMAASGARAMPSSPITTRRYSGYALRLAPPCTTKSSAKRQSASARRAYARVPRTSALSASGSKPPPSAHVTRCWTRTSSGASAGARASTSPAAAASRAAAASTSSSACVGSTVTRETSPGRWPLRPARCRSRPTPLGLPICSTWSTGAKSTPRSRLDVHTTARNRPSRSACSTHSRTSRPSEPWWSAIDPAQCGRASSSAWYQISALDRTLVKTSVERADSIARTTSGSRRTPMCPAHGKRSIVAGASVAMSICFASSPRTMRAAAARSGPSSAAAASVRLASVADRPQTRRPGRRPASRARASSTCTPRFDDNSSCHSSTTSASRCAKRSRQSARDRNSERLSGVVTSTVGSRRAWRAREASLVSPVRTSTDQCGASARAASASASPVSPASARSGVTHSMARGGGWSAVPRLPPTIAGSAAA